jgi:hypothetical protein
MKQILLSVRSLVNIGVWNKMGAFLFVCFLACCTCSNNAAIRNNNNIGNSNANNDSIEVALLEFVKKKYDFGKITNANSIISADFNFENIGNTPLLIYKVDASCGCLSAKYPKYAILPNQKEKIKVEIDIRNLTGKFDKTLIVKSNSKNDLILLHVVGQIE